jgi:hypothetical protein
MHWGRIISTLAPLAMTAALLLAFTPLLSAATKLAPSISDSYPGYFGDGDARRGATSSRRQLAAAQREITWQRAKINRLHRSMERALQDDIEYIDATAERRDARRRIEAIRTPILVKLHGTPEMQALFIDIRNLETELEAARQQARGPSKKVMSIASQLLGLRSQVRAREAEALAQSEELAEALEDLVDASQDLREMQRENQMRIRYSPELAAAREALAAAKARKIEAARAVERGERQATRQERDRLERIVQVSLSD